MIKNRVINGIILVVCIVLGACSTSNRDQLILGEGAYKLHISPTNLSLKIVEDRDIVVPADTSSAIFINEQAVTEVELVNKELESAQFHVSTAGGETANVEISFKDGIAIISVKPEESGKNKVSLRFGGMPVAHGLGDAGGWNKTFDLANDEEKTFEIINNGGGKRWISTFTIFPKNDFAGVFFDRGKKSVRLSESTYQLNTEIEGKSTFYLFVGEPKEIYANYKKVRNEHGFEDIKPKSRLFELGWESWDALGWNTNQFTVKDILAKFHKEGYPIRWAVTGSGFWDEGGTTTSFGRYGAKFPDTESFRSWMHQNDIYWMIGLRTNMIPSGGPYFPKTKKRDKNLKVKSYYGNDLSDEALEKDYFLNDADGKPRLITSTIFPIVPCYLLDGNKPGVASWFQKNYAKWKVDGIKEDTMMDLDEETSIFNKPIAKIATEGGHVLARCGEFSSPGTLQRINDTGVLSMQNRTTINYLQYAASGVANVYSDVCGVHNMHNLKAIDANIRHTWLLSLTAGMAVGAFPSKWSEKEQETFKKAIDFHYTLVPYLYGAGMETFETGFPYTLTPMGIAFPNDEKAVEFENFQWMIGESVLATPLLKNYQDGKKDIYLPEGTWFDWESGEKFTGPTMLSDYEIPLEKVPCFVGGKGIVLLRKDNSEELIARVYEVGKKATSDFYTLETSEKYSIEVANTTLENVSIKNLSSGKSVAFKKKNGYIEFPVVEGNNYQIN